jgi:hypothetical protein
MDSGMADGGQTIGVIELDPELFPDPEVLDMVFRSMYTSSNGLLLNVEGIQEWHQLFLTLDRLMAPRHDLNMFMDFFEGHVQTLISATRIAHLLTCMTWEDIGKEPLDRLREICSTWLRKIPDHILIDNFLGPLQSLPRRSLPLSQALKIVVLFVGVYDRSADRASKILDIFVALDQCAAYTKKTGKKGKKTRVLQRTELFDSFLTTAGHLEIFLEEKEFIEEFTCGDALFCLDRYANLAIRSVAPEAVRCDRCRHLQTRPPPNATIPNLSEYVPGTGVMYKGKKRPLALSERSPSPDAKRSRSRSRSRERTPFEIAMRERHGSIAPVFQPSREWTPVAYLSLFTTPRALSPIANALRESSQPPI